MRAMRLLHECISRDGQIPVARPALALLAACIGCTTGGAPDAWYGDAHFQSPPRTYDFVVRQWTIDRTDDPATPHTGLDVDHRCSGPMDLDGCRYQDFFSQDDDDQHSLGPTRSDATSGCAMGAPGCRGCVDNQFPGIVNSFSAATMAMDIRALLDAEVAAGRRTTLVRVADVNSLRDDPSVRVRIYDGYPTFEDCGAQFGGHAEFAVAQRSLRPGGRDIDADAITELSGRIVGGRLIAGGSASTSFDLLPPVNGAFINVPIHEPQLRLSLSADGSDGTRGVLAGWWEPSELLADRCWQDHLPCEAIVSGVVDVLLPGMSACVDRSDPRQTRFGGISFGIGLSVVHARILAIPIVARIPGMCGSPPPCDGCGGRNS